MKPLDRWLQAWRIARARRFIPPGARVLDVGCGDGALFTRLASRGVVGVGLDPRLGAPRELPNATLHPESFPSVDRTGFDVVTCLAVLEHIPAGSQTAFARACAGAVKSGGRVILTVPSPRVDAVLKWLLALRLLEGQALEEHHGFDPAAAIPLFTGAGLRLLRHERFQLGLNNLFVFERPASPP